MDLKKFDELCKKYGIEYDKKPMTQEQFEYLSYPKELPMKAKLELLLEKLKTMSSEELTEQLKIAEHGLDESLYTGGNQYFSYGEPNSGEKTFSLTDRDEYKVTTHICPHCNRVFEEKEYIEYTARLDGENE